LWEKLHTGSFFGSSRICGENMMNYRNTGVIFQKRGQLKDARYHYTKAVRLDPDYTDARRNLNFISQKIGLSAGH